MKTSSSDAGRPETQRHQCEQCNPLKQVRTCFSAASSGAGVGTAGVVESGQTLRSGLVVSLPPPPAGCKNNDFNPNKTAGWTYRPRAAVAPRHTAAAAVQIDRLQAPVALR